MISQKVYRQILVLFLVGLCLTLGINSVKAYDLGFFLNQNQNFTDAPALVERGQKHYQLGQYTQSVANLEQAVNIFAEQGDTLNQAITLSNLALAYQELGEWQKAETAINNSLTLVGFSSVTQVNDLTDEQLNITAAVLNINGRLNYQQGKIETALDNWRQAGEIYQQLNNQSGIITTYINELQGLQSLGLYQQAQVSLAKVQEEIEQAPPSLQVEAWRSVGEVLQTTGNINEAQEVLQKSLTMAREMNNPNQISKSLLTLGNSLWAEGNLIRDRQDISTPYNKISWQCITYPLAKESIALYQQAAEKYQQVQKKLPSSLLATKAQLNLLHLWVESGNLAAAEQLWSEINITDLPPSKLYIYAQINLAQNLACLKQKMPNSESIANWQEIDNILARTVELAQSLEDKQTLSYALGNRGGLYEYLGKESGNNQELLKQAQKFTEQALFLAQPLNNPSIAYRWQWQLGRILASLLEDEEAITAYQKSVETLSKVRSNLLAINADVQFSFRDDVEPVYRQLVDLLLKQDTPNITQERLAAAITLIDNLQLAELENFLRCNLIQSPEIITTLNELKSAAFIYPIILEDRLDVIYKLPGEDLRYQVNNVDRYQVETASQELRRAIDRRNPESFFRYSEQLYEWLIKPLDSYLQESSEVDTLVFVLDGYLRNIPMAVLRDKDQNQYLVEKEYALALLPTSGLFNIGPSTNNVTVLAGAVSEKLLVEDREFRALDTEREVTQIQQLTQTEALLNAQFTQVNVQQQLNQGNFSVVHLATHGKFSSDPEETFILAYGELLRPNDISNLLEITNEEETDSIDLLVLSACQTASGDNRAALGLAGLAVRAGAESTLATLWQVSDKYTIPLITRFYQELSKGLTKAQALHEAQKSLVYKQEFNGFREPNEPYDWGAYVLVGNWQ